MTIEDRFGLPLTVESITAAEDYGRALDLLLAAWPGAEALLDRAIAADPGFALAHIARARLLQLQARMAEARAAAERARGLAERLTPRERGHVETVASAIAGRSEEALARVREHAALYPRDALPLSLAMGVFSLLGFGGRRDFPEVQLALLEDLAPHWDEDWWYLGYLGWAYIETGAAARGIPLVERSLALNPRNAHAAHQRAHGYFETGDAKGGIAFLDSWLPLYDRSGHLHCHLSWHLALFEAACGNSERARALYFDAIRPAVAQTAPLLSLADSASLLWRWRLYGMTPPMEECWTEVADHARRHFPQASLAFADLHAGFAEAATDDSEGVANRIAGLRALAAEGRLPPGETAPALAAGAAAFARGEWDEAARLLQPAVAELPRIGGSHAQREIFEDTLIAAYRRAGRVGDAAALLRRRLDRRPSARDATWLEAAEAGLGSIAT